MNHLPPLEIFGDIRKSRCTPVSTVSTTPVVLLERQKSPRIFEEIQIDVDAFVQ